MKKRLHHEIATEGSTQSELMPAVKCKMTPDEPLVMFKFKVYTKPIMGIFQGKQSNDEKPLAKVNNVTM